MRKLTLIAFLTTISIASSSGWASAQETNSAAGQTSSYDLCQTTDGRKFITTDTLRLCLKFEVKADNYDQASEASEAATATANQWRGQAKKSDEIADEERERADDRLVELVTVTAERDELRKRPRTWVAVAGIAGGTIAGIGIGILVGILARGAAKTTDVPNS